MRQRPKAYRLRKPAKRRVRQYANPTRVVRTQDELDAAWDDEQGVVVEGGTALCPLILRRPFAVVPVIGDDAAVVLQPSDRNHPPSCLIQGAGANVLLLGSSRATCLGASLVRAKDTSKAKMFAGKLIAGGTSRHTLYNDAVAVAWGDAKLAANNAALVALLERSRAYIYHESTAYVLGEHARAWPKSRRAVIRFRDPHDIL